MKKQYFLWKITRFFLLFLISLPAVAQNWELKQTVSLENLSLGQQIEANDNFLFASSVDQSLSEIDTSFAGVVHIYKKFNGLWVYADSLKPPTNDICHFGRKISFDGNRLAVSSTNKSSGSEPVRNVHIFEKQQGIWVQTQKITQQMANASGGCATTSNFAGKIIIKNNFLFIQVIEICSGKTLCYIYKNINGTWTYQKKIGNLNTTPNMSMNNMEVVGNWFIENNNQGYDFNNCLNSASTSCNVANTSSFSTLFPLLNIHKDFSPKASNTYTGVVQSSTPPYKFHTYQLNTNNTWQQQMPFDLPPSTGNSWTYNTEYTDSTLIITTGTGYAVGASVRNEAEIYTYDKVGIEWIQKNKISLPLWPFQFQPGTIWLPNIRIIDNNNFIVVIAVPKNGWFHYAIQYYQRGNNNLVKGNVFSDLNNDCAKNIGERSLKGFMVKAEPSNKIAYTDQNGDYELVLGAGVHTIKPIFQPNQINSIIQSCPTQTITFNNTGNTSVLNFGNKMKECTFLTVDVTSRRRRCFRNQTIVKYENEGFAAANNAYITVTFPEYVIPLSSTNPWVSQVGNTYTFNVGTLQAGQAGHFIVTDSVACVSGIQGLIQCTEAKIYPKNTCASPTWSGASLEIVGKCLDIAPHKGRFVLRNTGTASMQSSYKIWQGNTLILSNLLTLAQGDSLVLEIPTNNENLFIQANQATGHPDGALVSAMVMNCGNILPTPAGSPNLQMMILPNDEYANSELDCMPIVDSYDPNDKAVSPAGITENNYVKPNTELEYKIRFQNMGTAEAVNIVVIDTLSTHLDLTTFQMMSASHTYKLKFERVNGKQVAFWTFTDINLPAKSVNEPASHGYIKFKIKHLPTIAEGTIIKNFADIYFDYNEPVRTNETAINMTDYQFPVNPVDYCSLFTQAQAGQARTVCGDSYTLEGNLPTMGQGTWTRISGAGEIAEPHNPNSLVTNLGIGANVFKWTFSGVPNCPNTESIVTITFGLKPAKPIIAHTALYELKSSVEGDSYAWYKDNVLITNNLPTLKVQKLGKYRVVVTKNGCSSPTSDEFVLNGEALKKFADLVKVETYPNPTTGKFTLNITNNQGSEVTVQFYNSLGQLLTEQRVEASEDIDCKVSIDFTHYKQGVYYAKIVNQYGLQTTQKIVIQKQ